MRILRAHERSSGRSTARAGKSARSQSGQSLVELAFILPVLLLTLLGVIELGRYAYFSIIIGNSARAGAAYGSQGLAQSADPIGIAAAATNDFQNGGQNPSALHVCATGSPCTTICGCDSNGTLTPAAACTGTGAGKCATGHWVVMVSVTASATFNSLFHYPGTPSQIAVSKNSVMRVNQ